MRISKFHSLAAVSFVLVSARLPAWGINLPFAQVQTGTIGSVAQYNAYTFSANANDLLNLTMLVTGGGLIPKIQIYNPNGTLNSQNYSGYPFACSGTLLEMNTVLLASTGTYTVDISDCGGTNTGSYSLYAQRTNNPTGASVLPFNQVVTGQINSALVSDAYTFSANASDLVDFTMVVTSGALIPKMRLYNPNGTLNNSNYSGYPFACSGSALEMNTVTLPTTGTYLLLIGDCGDTNSGGYSIYTQRTDAPAGPTGLVFGQVQTGAINSVAASGTYTFSANAGDVADFTLMTTGGSLIPRMRLYNPNGTLNNSNYSGYPFACSGSALEMNTVTLPTSGTYTLLIGDCSDTNTGNYVIYSQRTNNPSGAANLAYGAVQTSLVGSIAANDSLRFNANAGDVENFTMVVTSGAMIPRMRLYNPNGTLNNSNYSGYPFACSGTVLEMNTVTLATAGTYTLLVSDCGDTNTGNYLIFMQRTNAPAGAGGILWGQVQSGSIGSTAQSASYVFAAGAGDMANLTVTHTSGSLIPKIALYNPTGALVTSNYSGYPFACSGVTAQLSSVSLSQSGTYTMLVADCGDTGTGTFNISSQCFGACPNPAPTLASLSPSSAVAGGSGFTLTVNGANFVSNSTSTVYWNGSIRTTSYVSSTQLTAVIAPSDIATAGTFPVTVQNPSAMGGPSNAVTFTVTNPLPAPASLSPSSVAAGSGGFTLTVNGSNFVNGALVQWNGGSRTTTFIGSTQLQVSLSASDVGSAGSASVTVVNPGPGGGTSGTLTFGITSTSLPVLSLALTHAPALFVQGNSGDTVQIVVSNTSAAPTSAAVTVGDTLPSQLTVQSISASGWNCTVNPVSCVLSGTIAPGQSAPPITIYVSVAANAHLLGTNNATASGGGAATVSGSDVLAFRLSSTNFVNQQYLDLLGRTPDAGGLQYWASQLNAGNISQSQLAFQFFASNEFQATAGLVIEAYIAVLGRDPDFTGWSYWLNNLRQGGSALPLFNAFVQSTEFQNTYGALDNAGFVSRVYLNVLGRAPDSQGLTYWTGQLNSGALSRAQIMNAFVISSEFQMAVYDRSLAVLLYMGFLRRSPESAGETYWIGVLQSGASPASVLSAFITSTEYLARF